MIAQQVLLEAFELPPVRLETDAEKTDFKRAFHETPPSIDGSIMRFLAGKRHALPDRCFALYDQFLLRFDFWSRIV
jgi:hypothetical protein